MDKDIIWYAENICGVNLTETQKEILNAFTEAKDGGKKIFLHYGRTGGISLMKRIYDGFEIWLKDHKIAVLERALELACEKLTEIEMIDVVIQSGYVSGEPKDIANYFKSKAESDIKNEKE